MAKIKFELTEDHIKLMNHLSFDIHDDGGLYVPTENGTPYGGFSLIEDCGLILYGKPEESFDPISPYGPQYSEEQKEYIKKIYNELPYAIEIVLTLKTFKIGKYKRSWNQLNWENYG